MGDTMAMRGRVCGLFVLAALVPGSTIAFPGKKDGFDILRHSVSFQRAVLNTARETSAYKAAICDSAKLSLQGPLYTLHAPVFDKKGKALSGDWAERIVIKGCGPDQTMNVLVHVKSPGSITTEPLLPGTTNASLQLQMDSISFAFDAARVNRAGCKPIYILDTEFKQFFRQPDATISRQPWSEVWTVAQCGNRAVVKMTFMPDRTGTAISASSTTGAP